MGGGLGLTLTLLQQNEGGLPQVFATEAKAAHFMIRPPDYREGIRARIFDKIIFPGGSLSGRKTQVFQG